MRLLALLFVMTTLAAGQPRPSLVITRSEAQAMHAALGSVPLLDSTYARARALLEDAFAKPMDVPRPVDAGGYTHERHKLNYTQMQTAGVLYAMTGEPRYAQFVRDMLLLYAELYPTLGLHPKANSEESGGRLFWQTLNETVWLVHVAQAYDCVYEALAPAERQRIENSVLRPMAGYFTGPHAAEHDRIHNHGTWMVTSVGMLGFALRDADLVDKALFGTKKDRKGGFVRQLDLLFSPDGYYTEGPYYTRYALMPFYLFAQAIDHNRPEMHIFAYRDSILAKALTIGVQQLTPAGRFIPYNDALKEMAITAKEMVSSLDVTYARGGHNPQLLDIAERQGVVMLSGAGLEVARDIAARKQHPFRFASVELLDGPEGKSGAVGLLRAFPANEQSLLVLKYAAQGMGHGHFDRLGFSLYEQEREVIQDYGSVRFINVEPKFGGRYLEENRTWSKQTIAHNTVTVDERSQFEGSTAAGEKSPGVRHFFAAGDAAVQVMSGREGAAYPGVQMQRTMALVQSPMFSRPVVIDVFRCVSAASHTYDLPFYYMGQLVNTSVRYDAATAMRTPLGTRDGYQHLWREASGRTDGTVQFSWLQHRRYYTVTSAADSGTEVLFVRIGANDPNFNLRNEPAVILRRAARSTVFASVIEPHGEFEPVQEISNDAQPRVQNVRVMAATEEGTVVEITGKGALRWRFMVANGAPDPTVRHTIEAAGELFSWTGPWALQQ